MRSGRHRVRRLDSDFASYLETHTDFDLCTLAFTDLENKNAWIRKVSRAYNLSLSWRIREDFMGNGKAALLLDIFHDDFFPLFASDDGLVGEAMIWLLGDGRWDKENKVWYAPDFEMAELSCDLVAACFDKWDYEAGGILL
ncbi:MAG: hypothetical protein IIY98_00895 [Aeriscardovia sp.]|nr:hypothetical protein [Aeriscardovia sp.]